MTNFGIDEPLRFWIDADATEEEVRHHFARAQLISDILLGNEDPYSLPDLLLSQGENPDEYLDAVTERLEEAVHYPYPDEASLLWLPYAQD